MPMTLLLCLPTDCPYDPEGGGGWGRVSLPELSLGHGCSELQAGVSCESSVAQMCLHGRYFGRFKGKGSWAALPEVVVVAWTRT